MDCAFLYIWTALLLNVRKTVLILQPPWLFLVLTLILQETRTLAEIAKAELDGTILNNRPIRIRFATHGAALTVRNLLPVVTNELLEQVEWTPGVSWPVYWFLWKDMSPENKPPCTLRHFLSSGQWSGQLLWQMTEVGPLGEALWSLPTKQLHVKPWSAALRVHYCWPRKECGWCGFGWDGIRISGQVLLCCHSNCWPSN